MSVDFASSIFDTNKLLLKMFLMVLMLWLFRSTRMGEMVNPDWSHWTVLFAHPYTTLWSIFLDAILQQKFAELGFFGMAKDIFPALNIV